MNTHHTPGPWLINGNEIEALVDPENSQNYYAPVCTIETDWSEEVQEANARLIAAAPDMLKTIYNLLDQCIATSAWDDAVRGEDEVMLEAVNDAEALLSRIHGFTL